MRRKDERGVSPVIATILMVAITVVLAAVLYMMVVGFVRPTDQPPMIVVREEGCGPDSCDGIVTSASEPYDLSRYRVTVLADGDPVIDPTRLEPSLNVSGGGVTFRFTDLAKDGRLNAGDTFRLSGMEAGVSYRISVLWHTGDELESIDLQV